MSPDAVLKTECTGHRVPLVVLVVLSVCCPNAAAVCVAVFWILFYFVRFDVFRIVSYEYAYVILSSMTTVAALRLLHHDYAGLRGTCHLASFREQRSA